MFNLILLPKRRYNAIHIAQISVSTSLRMTRYLTADAAKSLVRALVMTRLARLLQQPPGRSTSLPDTQITTHPECRSHAGSLLKHPDGNT